MRPGEGSWEGTEPGWREFACDLRRLYTSNRAHPLPVVLLTLAATVFCAYQGYFYQPDYKASIVLRLTEENIGVDVKPSPVGELRAFINDVALSDRRLIGILDKFGLYQQERQRGVDQAVDEFRSDIGVRVWRNEFLLGDPTDPLGRAARVELSFKHADPELAYRVVDELARTSYEEQQRMRRAQMEYLSMELEPAIKRAEELVQERVLEMVRMQQRGEPVPARITVALVNDIEGLRSRLNDLIKRRNETLLRLRAETQNLGLRLDILDSVKPRPIKNRRLLGIAGGLLGFSLGILLFGLLIHTFDRRIYNVSELMALGHVVCGSLPSYPMDDVGSMSYRMRMSQT